MLRIKSFYKLNFILLFSLGIFICSPNVLATSVKQDNKKDEKVEKKEGEKEKQEDEKVIKSDKLTHDFGTIKEVNGEETATFTITNNTDAPIVMNKVTASCGCSNTTWTKEPIAPGKTGKVTVSFNPTGQFGPIEKQITVFTSGEPNRIVLYIKGIVE